MKNKFLFSALGLTVAFAACTNEDIMETNVNNAALEGRKVVDLEIVTGLESRANASGWESTDKIGSILVDPTALWDVESDKHHGNNRWDLNGSSFTTQGTTVEGAWMFYFPYSTDMSKERGALKAYKSIVNQEYDATGDKMYANDFAISPVYYVNAAEGGAKIDVILNSVYAYGNIVAALPEAAAGAKVSKVLLKYDTPFANSLRINAEKVAALAAMNYAYTETGVTEANPDGMTPQALIDNQVKQWWNCDSTKTAAEQAIAARNGLRNYTKGTAGYATEAFSDIAANAGETTSDYILIDCAESKALTDTMFSTRVLLPAGTLNDDIELYIYTDKGVFSKTISGSTQNPLYFKRGLKADLHNVNRIADTEDVEQPTHLSMDVADATTTPIVETTDLVNLIKQFDTENGEMDVKDQLMGSVVFNDAVAEALEANSKIQKLIVENINIECTKAQTVSKLVAESEVIVKSGSALTIKGNWNVNDLTIAEGASVIVEGAVSNRIWYSTNVKGSLTINDGVTYKSEVNVYGGTVVCGSAVATVAEAAKDITVRFAAVETGSLTINVPVTSNKEATWGSSEENASALTVTINADLSNNKTTNVCANATVTNNATLSINENVGTITNNKNLKVETNNGTVNNNVSVVTSKGSKVVVTENAVNGTINTIADSQTDVTTNKGLIYYAEDAFINGELAGAHTIKGNIVYKVASDMTADELAEKLTDKVTAIEIESAKLTIPAEFEMTKLAALQYINMLGSAEVVANETVQLVNCPVYVSGTSNVVSGTSPIQFVRPAGYDSYNTTFLTISLAADATLEIKTVIKGVEKVNLGKDAMIVARTNVYGPNENVINYLTGATAENTSWLGTAYEIDENSVVQANDTNN